MRNLINAMYVVVLVLSIWSVMLMTVSDEFVMEALALIISAFVLYLIAIVYEMSHDYEN